MNELVKKTLLTENEFLPEMHLRQPDLRIFPVDHLLKTKKEFKDSNKHEIQDISTKMSKTKLAFTMTWLMGILKIYREEQIQIKY